MSVSVRAPGDPRRWSLGAAAMLAIAVTFLLLLPAGVSLGGPGDGIGLGALSRATAWASVAAGVLTLLAARASMQEVSPAAWLLIPLALALALARMPVLLVGLLVLAGCSVPALADLPASAGWRRALLFAALAAAASIAGGSVGRQHGDELIAGLVVLSFLVAAGMLPFGWHMVRWLEGAPAPIAALVSSAVLPAVIAAAAASQPLVASLHEAQRAGAVLGWFGAATAVAGAVYAMGARDWRGLALRTLPGELGLALVGVSAFDIRGLQAAALTLLVLACTRPALVFADVLASRRGVGLVVTALALLACAGLPPSLGFPARLLVISAAGRVGAPLAVLVLVGMVLELAAIAVVLRRRLGAEQREDRAGPLAGAGAGLAALLALALVGGGLFPGLLLRFVFQLAG
ncbi:MAG: proton-conducting transporter membrane subunit [Candidatus Dormibacteria bacterium]